MDSPTYTYEEALAASLAYFDGNASAAQVWLKKYAPTDADGRFCELSPNETLQRISAALARIEAKYPNALSQEEIFALLDHFRHIVLGERALSEWSRLKADARLGSSVVVGLEGDTSSYGGVMKVDEEVIQILKRGGRAAHDLSQIHPKGLATNAFPSSAAGVLPFAERYEHSAREVVGEKQSSDLLLTLSVKHPDAEDLLEATSDEGPLSGVPVVLQVDDDFMHALSNGAHYTQQYPVDAEHVALQTDLDPVRLWKKIIHRTWQSADTALVFTGADHRECPADCYAADGFRSTSVTPYGKIPLSPYETNRYLALNLLSYVDSPFTEGAKFDFKKFQAHAHAAARLADDLVDEDLERIDRILQEIEAAPQSDESKATERHLWEKIRQKTAAGRRIGIGITGFGDMLAAMGIRYGLPSGSLLASQVMKALTLSVYHSSVTLAEERGPFSIYNAKSEADNPFILHLKAADAKLLTAMKKHGRRNIACIALAPTATTAILAQTSAGIEPVSCPAGIQRRKVNAADPKARIDVIDENGDTFEENLTFHPPFLRCLEAQGIAKKETYTAAELAAIVEKTPYKGAAPNDIKPSEKIETLAAVREWADQSVSTTIVLPSDADEELISQTYKEAWAKKCCVCTIYREGARSSVRTGKEQAEMQHAQSPQVVEHRPEVLDCDVVRFQNNKEKWVALVGLLDGRPYEIFTGLQDDDEGIVLPKSVTKGYIIKATNSDGSHRYDFQFKNKRGYKTTVEGLSEKFNKEFWNYAKLISGVLRYRMPIKNVIKLVGSMQMESESINTWKAGVERALKKYASDVTKDQGHLCSVCGSESLVFEEGQFVCKHCGASATD